MNHCTGCVTPNICNTEPQCVVSKVMNTANKPAAQQVELDYHIRSLIRIIGEQVVESGRFKHVRATRDDVKDIVGQQGLDSRLTAYLVGMLGLEGER
jgi:hypothetical protein